MRFLFLIFFLVLLSSCKVSVNEINPASPAVSHAPDEEQIKKVIDETYHVICFNKGEKVKYDSIRIPFMPQAQFFNFRNDSLEIITLDQFIPVYKDFVESNGISLFYEKEIRGTTEQFGRIAHRISTYETYLNTMDSAAERGVNSFQLIKTSNGWKVTSIIWDVESEKQKIPAYYLAADSTD